MKKEMNKNFKIVSLALILLLVALGTTLWAAYAFNQPFSPLKPLPPPPQTNPGDLEVFYAVEAVISSLNIVLLVYLLFTNTDMFRKTRSKFTFGLLIFSMAFLVKDLTASPILIWAFGYRQQGLGPFAFVPNLFEFVVLCTLLYLSSE